MHNQELHCLLTECSIEIWREKIPFNTPKIGNGFVLTDRVGKSILLQRVYKSIAPNKCISVTVPKTLPAVSGSFF